MIKEAFLICALALPAESHVHQFNNLMRYFKQYSPGYEFRLIHTEASSPDATWHKVGLEWNDYKIWARKIKNSA